MAIANFNKFLDNIQFNFDDNTAAYLHITQNETAEKQLDDILNAIIQYQSDLSNWKKVIN